MTLLSLKFPLRLVGLFDKSIKSTIFNSLIPWRDGRVVEGTPLLRVQGRNPLESSNLSLSAI